MLLSRRRCGHCKQLAPHWGRVANSLKGVVRVGAVNCDADSSLGAKHKCATCRRCNLVILF